MSKKESKTMNCPRCDGFMIEDRFIDLQDDTGALTFEGLRCLQCGEILDPVIVNNRQARPARPMGNRNRRLLAYNN
jgi:methionyl-tRNA synthetase